MYQGFSKESGGIIGTITKGSETLDLDEAAESTSAEESLICQDSEGNEYALTAALNPESGELAWCPQLSKEQIMRRTVAMSQMTSMLRDVDRNAIYERAIQTCIQNFISVHQRAPVVLDIGCGTGLLSLLCLKHGASFVFGIEMFEEMSQIAQEVINLNNAEENILIINAKSTDIDSLPMVPDILVSEILDSALLGESCLPSHADAISRLLSMNDDPNLMDRVIPHSANVFATLVESIEVFHMHNMKDFQLKPNDPSVPYTPYRNSYADQCVGGWPLIPIHWKELQSRGARALSSAVKVLNFEFFHGLNGSENPEENDDELNDWKTYKFGEGTYSTDIVVTNDGTVHGVVLWWKACLLSPSLDPMNQCTYSTEPGVQNWQDHWQQTVFPLAEPIVCKAGDVIRLTTAHSSCRIWLTAAPTTDVIPVTMTDDNQQQQPYQQQQQQQQQQTDNSNNSNGGYAVIDDGNDDIVHRSRGRNESESDSEQGANRAVFRKRIKLNSIEDSASLYTMGLTDSEQMEQMRQFAAQSSQCLACNHNNITPHDVVNRLQSVDCACGWHLLCNTDRISMINGTYLRTKWEDAIVTMLNTLYANGLLQMTPNGTASTSTGSDDVSSTMSVKNTPILNIILDLGDGSLNALSTALALKKQSATGAMGNLTTKVVSREVKFFSKLFFSQLCGQNETDEHLFVWDGASLEDIVDYFAEGDDYDEDEDDNTSEMDDQGDHNHNNDHDHDQEGPDNESAAICADNLASHNTSSSSSLSSEHQFSVADDCQTTAAVASVVDTLSMNSTNTPTSVQIVSLISECFHYQLTALPTWQAISFMYQRTAMQPLLHPEAVIMPQQAFIMAAAFESDQLRMCHGQAGIVSGFNHAPLDARQTDWHTHIYPYKLANYQKRLLSTPVRITALNYNHTAESIAATVTQSAFHTEGRCDFIAIWVDYQLTYEANSNIECLKNGDFPPYMKVNLKFLEQSVPVTRNSMLSSCVGFEVGDSDFKMEFAVSN